VQFEGIRRMVVVPVAQLDAGAIFRIGDASRRAAERTVAVLGTDPVDAVPVLALHGVHVPLIDQVLTATAIGHQLIAGCKEWERLVKRPPVIVLGTLQKLQRQERRKMAFCSTETPLLD